jgi:hypothetical protein
MMQSKRIHTSSSDCAQDPQALKDTSTSLLDIGTRCISTMVTENLSAGHVLSCQNNLHLMSVEIDDVALP